MNNPGRVNTMYAVWLLFVGAYGYLWPYLSPSVESGPTSLTALIPAAFGVILLPMSGPMKRDNAVVAHIVVVLTLLIGIMMAVMYFRGTMEFTRKNAIFLSILVASILALQAYVRGFIAKAKAKRAAKE